MNPYAALLTIWGIVTLTLALLLFYRSRLSSHETDWIPLTDDDREERAIRSQTLLEMKAKRLVWPIRTLGTLSVVLLVAILSYWVYHGIGTPPPMP
jgi:hypothetical protein